MFGMHKRVTDGAPPPDAEETEDPCDCDSCRLHRIEMLLCGLLAVGPGAIRAAARRVQVHIEDQPPPEPWELVAEALAAIMERGSEDSLEDEAANDEAPEGEAPKGNSGSGSGGSGSR